MSQWILDKAQVSDFVTRLTGDYRVVGPVAKGTQFAFDEIDDPVQLRLDYNTTILPPKKVLQPQHERLLKFKRSGEIAVESAIEAQPTVLIGVHTCDLHAIRLLDTVFSTDHSDAHYLKRREQTLLIGIECLEPCDDHSFCKSMGTLTATEGYDLHLTDMGDAYFVDVGTQAGGDLIKAYAQEITRSAENQDVQALNKVLSAKWPRFSYKLDFDVGELATTMRRAYEHPHWVELGERCLACGTCTNVCPTCFCFDVYDKVALSLAEGERWRKWDSCQLDMFASVAGGENFREHRAERQRHRFMRKGRYLFEKYDRLGCVGCGRCARSCLVDISPVSTFNTLHKTV